MLQLQAVFFDQAQQLALAVTSEVPGPSVRCIPLRGMGGYRHKQDATRISTAEPFAQSGVIVLDVFKHLEGNDQREALLPFRCRPIGRASCREKVCKYG